MRWFLAGRVEETHNPEVTGSSPVPARKERLKNLLINEVEKKL